jgi:integrase
MMFGTWMLGSTSDVLPLPHEAKKAGEMSLFRKTGSPFWWYAFTFEGKRYRCSTKQEKKGAAAAVEAEALMQLKKGVALTKPSRNMRLADFSVRFFEWVENSHQLEPNTRRFYAYGWRLLKFTRLPTMPLDQITKEVVECTHFTRPVIDRSTGEQTSEVVPCSPTYTNQAIRTLKAMLGKAEEWKLIDRAPKITALKAKTRDRLIDAESEVKLQKAHKEPMKNARTRRLRDQAWLFLVILQDTGMRPDEVFPMRIEDIHWNENRIWIPDGKTENAKRFVGLSDRMKQMLSVWCSGREGWVFPSARSKSGHLTTINKGFQAARKRAGIDPRIVPYSARHSFGTYTLAATGNVFAVSNSMGHADIKSMEPYQHQDTSVLTDAINQRNARNWHTNWHTDSLEDVKTQ